MVEPSKRPGARGWRRPLTTLARYRWLILCLTLAGGAVGLILTRLLHPVYVAEATLWIEGADERGNEPAALGPGRLLDSSAWVELLNSYEVLEQVVRELRLYVRPRSLRDSLPLASFDTRGRFRAGEYRLRVDETGGRYVLTDATDAVVDRGRTGDSIGTVLGFAWAPPRQVLSPGGEVGFALLTLRDAAQRLALNLEARIDPEGSFLRIRLRGTDPHRITGIVNAVTARYTAVASELKRRKLSELTSILGDQLARAEQGVRAAEAALAQFQTQGATLPGTRGPESGDPVVSDYLDMRVTREQVRRDREAIERVLRAVADSALSVTSLERVGAVERSSLLTGALRELTDKRAQLRALQYSYSKTHPLVTRLAGQIDTLAVRTIPALARQLAADLRRQEADLERWIGRASRDLREIPGRSVEEARLRRQVEISEQLYTTVRRRYDEVRLAEASSLPDVRILDAAVTPTSPVKHTAPKILLASVLGSFGLSLLGVAVLGLVDRRVRFPEQVSFEMGLPILGAIPHVKGRGSVLTRDEANELVEALRGIRLNVLHAYGAPPPLLITVTSPGSGDGKSFVTSRLALAFADAGYRTVVIDGDVRRGQLHRVLGRRRRPGLIDHLQGRAALHELVQPTGFGPLDFIACGTRSQGGPELLDSAAMKDLLAALRAEYSVILVDSAPMAAAVDPFVLGTATGNLLLVLRTGLTDRELANAKLTVLDRLPIRPLGAVVNDVRAGASYHLYSYYLPGYESENEDTGPLPPPGRQLPASI